MSSSLEGARSDVSYCDSDDSLEVATRRDISDSECSRRGSSGSTLFSSGSGFHDRSGSEISYSDSDQSLEVDGRSECKDNESTSSSCGKSWQTCSNETAEDSSEWRCRRKSITSNKTVRQSRNQNSCMRPNNNFHPSYAPEWAPVLNKYYGQTNKPNQDLKLPRLPQHGGMIKNHQKPTNMNHNPQGQFFQSNTIIVNHNYYQYPNTPPNNYFHPNYISQRVTVLNKYYGQMNQPNQALKLPRLPQNGGMVQPHQTPMHMNQNPQRQSIPLHSVPERRYKTQSIILCKNILVFQTMK